MQNTLVVKHPVKGGGRHLDFPSKSMQKILASTKAAVATWASEATDLFAAVPWVAFLSDEPGRQATLAITLSRFLLALCYLFQGLTF